MRNVELKSRDPDPARTLERALALGAEDHGEIAQRDTYFARAHGRVKLREQRCARRSTPPTAHSSSCRSVGAC
jgi:adenylate cyclase class IV